MHSATDLVKIGTQALTNFTVSNNFTHICIIDENDSHLKKIAVALYKNNAIKVSFLTL